ncbi:serine hydrolase [Jiulongibacter sediminis]|uniref:serine hydrolase n=1 Tax=Jiulongibacter sediminis TaxID=1605367 RepID=UPI0026F292CF|nr:serine hydrolase [Jiulongibacter sediminis]
MNRLILSLALLFALSSAVAQQTNKTFKRLLYKNKQLKPFLKQAQKYRIQIIYTSIDSNGLPGEPQYFNYDPDFYFYPASTVKLPAALYTLEKLNEFGIDKSDPYFSTSTFENYASAEGDQNIEEYIQQIFLVSSNDAFNRLYDFLSIDLINQRFEEMGLENSRLTHRLSVSLSSDENRRTPYLQIGENYRQGPQIGEEGKTETPILLGEKYYAGDVLINNPMDFSLKNKFDLWDQQQLLRSLFFPVSLKEEAQLSINDTDLTFVKEMMSAVPRNYGYDEVKFPDGSGKFLMYGDRKDRIPEHLKIYNKIGGAYGFLIDNAFIEDSKNDVRFLLSAVIYVNENETLNDDTYEYDSKGLPFLGELGRHIYEFELSQKP